MASSVKKERLKEELFFEKVLAAFSSKFSSPSSDVLSTRCISKSSLLKHLTTIRDEIGFPGYKRIAAKDILFHLERSKIVHPINTYEPSSAEKQDNFYLLGLTSDNSIIDPIELLQALEPKGIICYFTAIDFYRLTTQIPSHHHIAKLVKGSVSGGKKEGNIKYPLKKGRVFNPLGNKKFIYEDVPFYMTNRAENLVQGVKERFLDDKTKFRITTLEQTLLDTLHKPLSCGGASVVFEVWENARDKIDCDVVFEYLKKINSNALSCRAGYMLQTMNYKIRGDFSDFLDLVKNSINRDNPELAISLLPGFDYHQLNNEWFIKVP